jgi:hypothetical protein
MYSRKVTKIYAVAAMVFCFLIAMHTAVAQTVKTFIDKQDILIGEQIKYKVIATAPAGAFNVQWLNIPDSLPHFELVDKTKIDTSADNGNTVLEQTITLTSFDSGRWNTPAFTINFIPANADKAVGALTDSFAVNVGYAAADSTNELRDIKPIMDVTIKSYLWYYIGGGIVLALIIAFFLWRYFKNRGKKPELQFKGKLSPYDEAMQELEKLKQFNLQQPEDIKQFHSKLAGIFKWYISRKQRFSIMNKTTGDVLVHLTDNNLPKEIVTETAIALRIGDAVKFAKYLPAETESNDTIGKIKGAINFINQPTANQKQQTTNNQ